IVLSLCVLAACKSAPPPVMYVLPENTPRARLANGMELNNGIERIEFSVSYGNVCKFGQRIGSKLERVFTGERSKNAPNEIADVPAGTPVRFFYWASLRGSRYCVIEAEALLAPDENYVVMSGVDFGGFFSRGSCAFAIRKADSGNPLSARESGGEVTLKKLDIPRFCVED
ncbi:MAG: hypothetical protein ABI612_21795, partial [Betaproteobacteria bacterium]